MNSGVVWTIAGIVLIICGIVWLASVL